MTSEASTSGVPLHARLDRSRDIHVRESRPELKWSVGVYRRTPTSTKKTPHIVPEGQTSVGYSHAWDKLWRLDRQAGVVAVASLTVTSSVRVLLTSGCCCCCCCWMSPENGGHWERVQDHLQPIGCQDVQWRGAVVPRIWSRCRWVIGQVCIAAVRGDWRLLAAAAADDSFDSTTAESLVRSTRQSRSFATDNTSVCPSVSQPSLHAFSNS